MKKILIMIMSCNQEHFINQENDCKDTYLSRLPENIDYIIYRGGSDNVEYNENTKVLHLRSKDDLGNTFKKTYEAFSWVINKYSDEYEYIFRTNTSTYVNIDLLNAFVQSLGIKNKHEIWGGEIVYNIDKDSLCNTLYIRGNGLLLNVESVRGILNIGWGYCQIHKELIDDIVLGCIYNNINLLKNGKYFPYIKSFKEGWYKASLVPYTEHQVCRMNNENIDFDFLKQMMIIQIRNWYDRTQESKHFKIIDEVFKNNKDNELNKTVQQQYEYSNNPEVFLGHNYGFKPFNNIFNNKR